MTAAAFLDIIIFLLQKKKIDIRNFSRILLSHVDCFRLTHFDHIFLYFIDFMIELVHKN